MHRGKDGDELEDYAYNPTKPRRRSNSFSAAPGHNVIKTKFEHIEPEPVFEEELHGPSADDMAGYEELEKSSTGSASVDDEDVEKK